MQPAPRVNWWFAALCAVVVTALFTVQQSANTDSGFLLVLERQTIVWGLWLALSPLIIASSRRHPFWEGSRKGWIARQLWGGGWFSLAHSFIGSVIRFQLGIAVADNMVDATVIAFFTTFGRNYLTYAMIAAVYQAVAYHYTVRERDARAARLEVDLAEAKLSSLEGRLRPHFLFNTLNAITALIRDDPRAAEVMLGQLSELLRASLRSDPSREVPLDEELDLVEQYLAIQRVRFRDRLHASLVADDSARQGKVPQLILQPLVENAIRHGIGPRESGGSVWVYAEQVDQRLRVTVEDDGVGMGNAPPEYAGGGLGLGGVKSRLAHLYGPDHRLDVVSRVPTGTRVTIDIPYRAAEVAHAAMTP